MEPTQQQMMWQREEDIKNRQIAQAAMWRLSKKAVKWTLLAAGTVAVVRHFTKDETKEESEI
jgi:hypothetical protein